MITRRAWRWLHEDLWLQHTRERQHSAYTRWVASGYRDFAAFHEHLDCYLLTQAILNAGHEENA